MTIYVPYMDHDLEVEVWLSRSDEIVYDETSYPSLYEKIEIFNYILENNKFGRIADKLLKEREEAKMDCCNID